MSKTKLPPARPKPTVAKTKPTANNGQPPPELTVTITLPIAPPTPGGYQDQLKSRADFSFDRASGEALRLLYGGMQRKPAKYSLKDKPLAYQHDVFKVLLAQVAQQLAERAMGDAPVNRS